MSRKRHPEKDFSLGIHPTKWSASSICAIRGKSTLALQRLRPDLNRFSLGEVKASSAYPLG